MHSASGHGGWIGQASPSDSSRFMAAVLVTQDSSLPVRVREMSSSAATVEGPVEPDIGAAARLVRGRLQVGGTILSSEAGRCTIRFRSLVPVHEWLAPPANLDQERIDEAVWLIKAGSIPLPTAASRQARKPQTATRLALDLEMVIGLLDSHTDYLTDDETTPSCFDAQLQHLDIARQTIVTVAEILRAGLDNEQSISRLHNLRLCCHQAIEGTG